MRKAAKARAALRKIDPHTLVKMCGEAGEYYLNGTLEVGTGTQTQDDFCALQSASTGLPVEMCRANMHKIAFVLKEMDNILDALTRGLPLDVLAKGYGVEDRGVTCQLSGEQPGARLRAAQQ